MCNAMRMESRKQISDLERNKREMNDQNEKRGWRGGGTRKRDAQGSTSS